GGNTRGSVTRKLTTRRKGAPGRCAHQARGMAVSACRIRQSRQTRSVRPSGNSSSGERSSVRISAKAMLGVHGLGFVRAQEVHKGLHVRIVFMAFDHARHQEERIVTVFYLHPAADGIALLVDYGQVDEARV